MAKNSLFKRGYKAVEQEKTRQEEEKAKRSSQLWRFFLLGDGDEADIRFLTEEPITFQEHTLKTYVNGKERYDSVTCAGDDCPHCENGDRPSFKGAYLVVDRREFEYKDKDGKKKTGKDQVRLFVQGTKVLSQLDRISTRYGISNREMVIVRLGKGTGTSYTLERGDESKLSTKEIENLLPESLRTKYNGTVDSLYSIVEEQIELGLPKDLVSDKDSDDDMEEEYNDKIVSVDEDEEEEKPKRKLLGGKKKSSENSLKSKLKKK